MRALAYFLGIASGIGFALQIGMNSRLRTVLQNANTAALISFLVGTVGLIALLIATRAPMPARDALASVPLWAWFGGLMGAFYVAMDGPARTSDNPYSTCRRRAAGRGGLVDHALRAASRTKVHQDATNPP